MVTLDGNLSNPLDQKLHNLLGHLQYISPTTTIIYTTQSLHNQHNNILHTPYTYNHILHTGQPPHTLNHMDMYDACGLMQAKLVDFPRSDLV